MTISPAQALDLGAFVLERVTERPRRLREREDLARAARTAHIEACGELPTGGTWLWTQHRATWICGDAVVKVARGRYGEWSLRQDLSIRSRIEDDPVVQGWAHLVASTRWSGDVDNRYVVVEDRLPGSSLDSNTGDDSTLDRVTEQLYEVHSSTSHTVVADGNRLMTWLCGPAITVSGLLERWGHGGLAQRVRSWASRTADELRGRSTRVCLVHGDLWLGNVLGRNGDVTGLIDWDQAAPHDAALHDIVHFTFYPAAWERQLDLGLIVREALVTDLGEGALGKVLRQRGFDQSCEDIGLEARDALTWYWLRHTARMSAEPGHANNPRWVARNVVAVASVLDKGEDQ